MSGNRFVEQQVAHALHPGDIHDSPLTEPPQSTVHGAEFLAGMEEISKCRPWIHRDERERLLRAAPIYEAALRSIALEADPSKGVGLMATEALEAGKAGGAK